MKKISFICCYTKEDLLNDLKKSADCLTDYEIEWVVIDNRNNRFKSAASALNYGFNKSTSPIVIFLHHDIVLYDQATIDRVVAACEKGNIAGFAGTLPNGGELVSTISDGEDKEWTYDYDFQNQDWIQVRTCDECFIAMSRDTYHNVGGFDQENFDGWHFYVVDMTLQAAQRHIPVVVVRANAWHRSHGKIDKSFDKYKNILRKKYKNEYFKIYYPCGWTYTNDVFFYVRDFLHNIRIRLKGER